MALELLSKDEAAARFGKRGWTPKELIGKLNYASGLEAFDALRTPDAWLDTPLLVNLGRRDTGLVIEVMHNFKSYQTGVAYDDILEVAVERAEAIVEAKERSVIGRALAGGLLLGPVGAVVGGMTGLKPSTSVTHPDAFVLLRINDGAAERAIAFTCAAKHADGVERFLADVVQQ